MPRKRKNQQKELRPRLHVFCEGEKTEPNYLNEYIERRFPGTRLTLVRKTEKNTPIQLVEEAIDERKRSPAGDLFWVIYDRESERKYPAMQHDEACEKAKANNIEIAFSNVCFEVWILLHFQETVAAYDSYSELRKRSQLKEHIENYDKGAKWQYTDEEVFNARKNAIRLNKQTIDGASKEWNKKHQYNPYTDVYKLLDAINEFEEKYIG